MYIAGCLLYYMNTCTWTTEMNQRKKYWPGRSRVDHAIYKANILNFDTIKARDGARWGRGRHIRGMEMKIPVDHLHKTRHHRSVFHQSMKSRGGQTEIRTHGPDTRTICLGACSESGTADNPSLNWSLFLYLHLQNSHLCWLMRGWRLGSLVPYIFQWSTQVLSDMQVCD